MAVSASLFDKLAEALGRPSKTYQAAQEGISIPGSALEGYVGGLQTGNTITSLKNAPQIGQDQRQMDFLKNFGALSDAIGRKNAIKYMGPMSQRYGIDLSQAPASPSPAESSPVQIASSSMTPNIADSDAPPSPIIRRNPAEPTTPDYQAQLTKLEQDRQNGDIGVKEYNQRLSAIRAASRIPPSEDPVVSSEDALKSGKVKHGTHIISPTTAGSGKKFIGNTADGRPVFADSKGTLSIGEVPGGGPVFPKSSTMPTAPTRSSGEFANSLLPHIQDLRDLINKADQKGLVGPALGRVYSQFLAGEIGSTGDPDTDKLLGELRSIDSLTKSGTLKVHFGSRGGTQMFDHFSNILNSSKMSAAQLNGSLNGIESFLRGYAQAGNTGQYRTPLPTETPTQSTAQDNGGWSYVGPAKP